MGLLLVFNVYTVRYGMVRRLCRSHAMARQKVLVSVDIFVCFTLLHGLQHRHTMEEKRSHLRPKPLAELGAHRGG